ncbi:uncharacterized protein VTP21DRAFT_7043 [Calcarisporiella thermophila]|uniref:uncharacterized protein n=1 Tax=Calcarisporiella thermophila TaxID=911321 RepID=UPI00374481EC
MSTLNSALSEKEQHAAGKELTDEGHFKQEVRSIVDEFTYTLQFTWRAAIVGALLGSLIAASNMYVGLKVGWTFGANLFGAIFSFAILKSLSRILPKRYGGGDFGPKENCTAQTAATAAGGLSSGFVTAVPALYKLGLLSPDFRQDILAMSLWTIAAAFYGLFFAVPLRKHFVVNQDLPFPSARATAETIKSLHQSLAGEKDAMRRALVLAVAGGTSFVWSVIGHWIPGIFSAPHILFWIGKATGSAGLMAADEKWRWVFQWEFAFIGAGLMTPASTVLAFFGTTVIVYGIVGPLMLQSGYIAGAFGFGEKPTAQSFFLWPGVALMVFASFTELFLNYATLWRALKLGVLEVGRKVASLYARLKSRRATATEARPEEDAKADEKLGLDHKGGLEAEAEAEGVPALWWLSGIIASVILTCLIMGLFFGIPVYQTLIAVVLAFILSFVGIQSLGETDINPTGSIGKVTQLAFVGFPAPTKEILQRTDLLAANIASSAASQSADMVADLKTGQLLGKLRMQFRMTAGSTLTRLMLRAGASPRSQFFAQLVGSVFAVVVAISLFFLYASAYPCITSRETDPNCPFDLVSATIWRQVTVLLTEKLDIPRASIITTIVFAILAVAITIAKARLLPARAAHYIPSLTATGMAMVNTNPAIAIAMMLGWLISITWRKYGAASHERYMYSVSAGLISGVGIGGILKAVFEIAGVQHSSVTAGCLVAADGTPRRSESVFNSSAFQRCAACFSSTIPLSRSLLGLLSEVGCFSTIESLHRHSLKAFSHPASPFSELSMKDFHPILRYPPSISALWASLSVLFSAFYFAGEQVDGG